MARLRNPDARELARTATTVYDTYDRDAADLARSGKSDRVLPRARARHVEIRNGLPWKPYPGTLHLLPKIREIQEREAHDGRRDPH